MAARKAIVTDATKFIIGPEVWLSCLLLLLVPFLFVGGFRL